MYALIDGIAFDEIVLKHITGPNAESSTAFTFNAITNGNDDIKAIKRHRFLHAINV